MMDNTTRTEEKRWALERDLDVLRRAIGIAKDKKRLKEVQDFAKERKAELEMIEDAGYLEKIGLK
ncbi:MAG TPA: hypothetical protein CFH81_08780 [Sulfurovum sp. UBA12169]|nr:MAG TPA: hypothetical protein CFH81_08780 [Sulfurovum sp. UBA12169]